MLRFRRYRQCQRRSHICVDRTSARTQPRRIDNRVYFLGSFDLEDLHYRLLTARSGLPINVLKAVSLFVLAKLLEFLPLSQLPPPMGAHEITAANEIGRSLAP